MDVCQVAVVGAGPVGLLLAARLLQAGLDVRVLERQAEPRPRSRAIGIHPPGLRALAQIGIAQALIARGVRVQRGEVYAGERRLGDVSFTGLPEPYPFVLSVPQCETERLLEARVHELSAHAIERGRELTGLRAESQGILLSLRGGRSTSLRADVLVGCDGKYSSVREALEIGYRGATYPAFFMMADAHDDTTLGDAAAICLSRAGLVESFPLPGCMRRWVVATGRDPIRSDPHWLHAAILQRTGWNVPVEAFGAWSSFQAEHWLAERFSQGPVVLAGDAAHVVSPIGGQGMNLGFLDAIELVEPLLQRFSMHDLDYGLSEYGRVRRRAAQLARRRAELYMALGRARSVGAARDLFMRVLLSERCGPFSARLFTMQDPLTAPTLNLRSAAL